MTTGCKLERVDSKTRSVTPELRCGGHELFRAGGHELFAGSRSMSGG
jgi:hypothetical protein